MDQPPQIILIKTIQKEMSYDQIELRPRQRQCSSIAVMIGHPWRRRALAGQLQHRFARVHQFHLDIRRIPEQPRQKSSIPVAEN
jgi:hypothetical protein